MSESAYIVEAGEGNFAQAVVEASQRVPILVDFWAEWCGPCRTLGPILEKLAEEYGGSFILAKVDTEKEQRLAAEIGIRSLPTCKLVKDGRVIDEFSGALPEGQVRAFLDHHIKPAKPDLSAAESLREVGLKAMAEGDLDAAEQALRQAREKEPGNVAVTVALARVIAAGGDSAAAESLLETLPEEVADDPEVKALRAELEFMGRLAEAPDAEALQARLAQDAADSEAAYYLALHRLAKGDQEGALEDLFSLMRRDRAYGEDAARRTILEIFDLLGADDPLVMAFRRRLFAALY